jgi:diadenylate cyclase
MPQLKVITLHDALIDGADIVLVAYLIYRLLMLVRGTRAWRIIVGILVFVFFLYISEILGLRTLHWLLEEAVPLGPVALVILLLPELRQAIEGLGKLDRWTEKLGAPSDPRAEARTVEELVAAVAELAAGSIGALIVIEKSSLLDEIAANGVVLNARVSAPLSVSIFFEKNPLHDGAIIVRGDRILSAACRLPLSESSRLDSHVHMRHRAAVGITEGHDCLAVVVSEERGTIRIASDGRLRRLGSHLDLREILNHELRNDGQAALKARKARDRKPRVEAKRN